MATEGGKSFARRDKLLEIESKVRVWWDEKDVFKAEPGEKQPQPVCCCLPKIRGANVCCHSRFTVLVVEEEPISKEESDPNEGANVVPDKFKGKKSKAASKSSGQMFQWEIMRSFGLSDSEISKFQNPYEWLKFFPPLAVEDLKAFGLGCDWRRSFVTTDMNPFFDSFVKWQMRKLKSMGKIVKDMRYTIYSPLDGQPCADHDRATGEGVQPQEYTIIKMEVVPPFPAKIGVLEGKKVFLAAATLRPETMYGQTNCWVLPDGKYGAFEINDNEVFILTERAALNLAYQKLSRVPDKPTCLVELTGYDLIGLPVRSPLSFNEIIYALPMLTILTDKGTGIVTSVPSDAPDDYMALHDLKAKPAFRAKFGVKDEWVLPFEIVPIIDIPEFGDRAAEKVCLDLKIKSQNEKDKLAEAKRLVYLRGFTEGIMTVGEYAGRKVQEAKPLIRTKLIETGQAIIFSEPEKKVMSRSGDECVVALTDQWYITYGEPEWKKLSEECLSNMNLYSDETRHGFEHTLGWLNQWACSRSFGLGTRIPWDEEFLVESLSDSTIYMAYYTVAHLLQNGDMYGKMLILLKMTDEVGNFSSVVVLIQIFRYPVLCLNKMKQELNTGTHSILECNGHIMLNSEKMSKSTGNFRTLRQAIEEFSADATRFSLADAGDGVDDANFVFETANTAILRLTKEIAWMEEILAAESSLRTGSQNWLLRSSNREDEYRFSCGSGGMNRDLVWRFMDVQTRLITPFCPHYAEFVWRELLKKDGFVVKGWPTADSPDLKLKSANKFFKANSTVTKTFASEGEIMKALQESTVGQAADFRRTQKLCMPFLRFKKDEAIKIGSQALDLKLPFGEIEVLRENLDLIKRQLGLEEVEVLLFADPDADVKAGSLASLLRQNPPSPGNPTAIFLPR
ncbi:putative serine/threonine-protein kinase [Hibiscus syriacus]|uniref:leucine--tRNA ligase n=1 Tax=Hibiscus syriacus TaxID=106335 RepID=A0A6A3BZQ5_HIBSY|nr:putative serine/threonine-protein kinase [Hibiscus syriacus]